MDVVHLTPDDLNTTAAVITWPTKLKPVVDHAVEVSLAAVDEIMDKYVYDNYQTCKKIKSPEICLKICMEIARCKKKY